MKKVLILIFIWGLQQAIAQDLQINEIMISNVDEYMVDYDFPDSWVEIINHSNQAIDIKGYKLRLQTKELEEYTFKKSALVPANGYLTICCDKNGTDIHTSFRLDADGGKLALISPQNAVLDELNYPNMLAPGIGYGRVTGNEETWLWEKKATPNAENSGLFTDFILPNPIFNTKGHVMNSTEKVSITMPEGKFPEDTQIYISFNGEEPTKNSLSGKTFSFDINKTTIIRAKLISDSALSRQSITQSYIFHPRETNFPIISIVTDSIHLFDPKLGLFSSEKNLNNKENYKYDWRRPINMEYFGVSGDTALFNQLGETGLSGASSRAAAQKSLKLIANKRFGTKHLKGVFWNDKPNLTKNKSILLRQGGSVTNTYRITDAFVQTLFGNHIKALDWQAYTPSIVYINGEYYGVAGLRERSDENYIWAHYNGEENIERVEKLFNNSNSPLFQKFETLFKDESSTYEDIEKEMDMEQFANYLALQFYSANTDWPVHNLSFWRPNQEGGKWRWITKDVDYCGVALYPEMTPDILNFNFFKFLTISGEPSSQEYIRATYTQNWIRSMALFQKVLPMPEFEQLFVDRFATYLGDFLKPCISQPLLCNMRDEIIPELEATWEKHLNRKNANTFITSINKTLSFIEQRPRILYNHIAEYYNLGTVIPMTIQTNDCDIYVNGIKLTEGDFDGCYFSDRELRLMNNNNCGWRMQLFEQGKAIENQEFLFESTDISLYLRNYTTCDSVAIEAYSLGKSDFDTKLQELCINTCECQNLSEEISLVMEEPRYAYANITTESLPISKNDDLHGFIDFYDNDGRYFHKPVLLNTQGNSDNPKINLSVLFCDENWSDENSPSLTFGDWVSQDEFHLKAFYEDGIRGISEISYKLYAQMTDETSPNEGTFVPDAFPISLYINGSYYGIMSWQLKKHRKNMRMSKDESNHVWIDGTLNDKQIFQGAINWEKFEVRNPKDLYNMDGSDYNGDFPQEIIDEQSFAYTGKKKMKRCAEAKQHILELSSYYGELQTYVDEGTQTSKIEAEIRNRFDVESLINYMVFSLVTNNYDGFSKNWQWYTLDGRKWYVAPYDCNLTFGYNEEGTSLWPASQGSKKYDFKLENVDSNGPMLWIKKYFWKDVEKRYSQLREQGIISEENIEELVTNWMNRIGSDNYQEEFNKWSDSSYPSDNLERIKTWSAERISLLDEYLGFAEDTAISNLTDYRKQSSHDFHYYTLQGLTCNEAKNGIYIVTDSSRKAQIKVTLK